MGSERSADRKPYQVYVAYTMPLVFRIWHNIPPVVIFSLFQLTKSPVLELLYKVVLSVCFCISFLFSYVI